MDSLTDTFGKTGSLHHAYIIEGDRVAIFEKLLDFLESKVKFKTHGNPDFWHASFDSFGIEEGRVLKDMQSRRAFGADGKKVFIISLNFITREAQNSLLKVFEEPTAGTHFFVITPSAEIFLPTILSRSYLLSSLPSLDADTSAEKFLAANFSERMKMLTDIIEEKDKIQAIEFLNDLERALYTRDHDDPKRVFVLNQIIKCRNYLGDRSPSVKMILEHIALIA